MSRLRLLTLGAAAAATAAIALSTPGTAQQSEIDPALARSATLTAGAAARPLTAPTDVPAATARAVAADLAADIPLPDGGTFDGVRWEQAGGEFSTVEIAFVLQYNAACQWLRAWRDGRQTPTSAQVLADVPAWSAWRDTDTGTWMAQVAADVALGGGTASRAMLVDCDAAHEREVTYADAAGLSATR